MIDDDEFVIGRRYRAMIVSPHPFICLCHVLCNDRFTSSTHLSLPLV